MLAVASLATADTEPAQRNTSADHRQAQERIHTLPANPANLSSAHGFFFAAMPFNGLVWINPTDEEQRLHADSSLGSLDILELSGGRFLAAGRDRQLRILEFEQDEGGQPDHSRLRVVTEWTSEGIPTGLALKGDLLLVASGGAGLSIYRFHGHSQPPRLIGRFPHASYAKEAAFLPGNLAAVTDAHTSGIWILDLSNPQIPSVVQQYRVRGFADFLSVSGDRIAFTDRVFQTRIAKIDPTADQPMRIIAELPMVPPVAEADFIQRISLAGDSLLVAESHVGIRQFQEAEDGSWELTRTIETDRPAIDSVWIETDSVKCVGWITLGPDLGFECHPVSE